LPQMMINTERSSLFDFRFEDFTLMDYQSHPKISAPIAV